MLLHLAIYASAMRRLFACKLNRIESQHAHFPCSQVYEYQIDIEANI